MGTSNEVRVKPCEVDAPVLVEVDARAQKVVVSLSKPIGDAFDKWIAQTRAGHVDATHVVRGTGTRTQARLYSARLNRQWRVMYTIQQTTPQKICVVGVTPHDYKAEVRSYRASGHAALLERRPLGLIDLELDEEADEIEEDA